MLCEDAEIHSDGGGKVSAARVVIRGGNSVARFLTVVFRKPWLQDVHPATVNGEPGLVLRQGEGVASVISHWIADDVRAIHLISNPDKLSRWEATNIQYRKANSGVCHEDRCHHRLGLNPGDSPS